MKYTFILAVVSLAFYFSGSPSKASWATAADADFSNEEENLDINVNKDGTYEVEMNRLIQILKESARTSMGVSHHIYDPEVADFKFIKGQTVNGTTVIPVESKFIEDKPLASGVEGFDSRNQLTVAFPDVKVGSKLFESYRSRVNRIPVSNFFSQRYYFGLNEFEKNSTVHFRSEVPLYIDKNDPLNKLKVTENKEGNHFDITIKVVQPIFTRVLHERNSSINEKDKTWVVISNMKSFTDIMNPLAQKYEAVISSKLPPEFQKIVDQAQKEKSSSDKFNVVTSELAELVRYVGDWREVKGAYEPHTLANIVKTKFGDCKDFAVSTAAMLRNLGFLANVVAIERGRESTPLTNLPLMSAFNHAMVRVIVDNQVKWVDPTNFQSFAQGLFEDVADRAALVLEPDHVRLERTPKLLAPGSQVSSNVAMNFFKDGDVAVNGILNLKGRSAISITGARLFATQEELSYQLATSFFPDQNLKEYNIEGLDLTSRIVRDTELKLDLKAKNTSLKTTAGSALRLPDSGVIGTMTDLDLRTRVSDLQMDSPGTTNLTYRLESVKMVGHRIKDCHLKSPWLDADLKISQTGESIVIQDSFVNHVNQIPVDELKTEKFVQFQSHFKDCFENIAVVYLPLGKDLDKTRRLTSE